MRAVMLSRKWEFRRWSLRCTRHVASEGNGRCWRVKEFGLYLKEYQEIHSLCRGLTFIKTWIQSDERLEFLLEKSEYKMVQKTFFCPNLRHSLPFSHFHFRLQGTALDSTDLPNMPAQPTVPQWSWACALGRPAWGPAKDPSRWEVVDKNVGYPRGIGMMGNIELKRTY